MTQPAAGAKTLDSGLRILWALHEHPSGLRLMELTRALGLDRNAVRRMVTTLVAHRLVTHAESGRYHLSLGVIELGLTVQPLLREDATRVLRGLADGCGATAFITAAENDSADTHAVVVSVVEPQRSFAHVAYRVGLRHPCDRGASGTAILAGRPARDGERSAIAHARARGYAVSSGELQAGAWGLAAPVRARSYAADHSVGVVSIGALEEDATAARVLRAAQELADMV